jgi:tetratricopeptide (TPR) repeat protein
MLNRGPENSVENSRNVNQAGGDIIGVPPETHARMMREQADAFRQEHAEKISLLERATQAEKALLSVQIATLHGQIAEYQRRIADPVAAYAEYQTKIIQLERLLEDATNATLEIGANRIADAKAAAERGDYAAADIIFDEVVELDAQAVRRTADAFFGKGLIAEDQVRWHDAYAHYKRAAALCDDLEHLMAYARMMWRLHLADEALPLHQLLCEAAKSAFGDASPEYAIRLNDLAGVVEVQGRFADAERLYTQALAIDRATIGERHPEYAKHLSNLAGVVRAQGRYAEAEGLHTQAIAIERATIGDAHSAYATHLNNLALAVKAQGRYAEAERLFMQALAIDRATIGEGHPDNATCLNNLAGVVQAQGRYGEAEGLYREALAIDRATIGEAHPGYATHLNNLAVVVRAQGRHAEAEGLYRQALAIDRATIGEGHPGFAINLNNLAGVVEAQGRFAEAEGLYLQALAIDRATIGAGHPGFATDLNNLAGVVRAQGRYSEAEGFYAEALRIAREALGGTHPNTRSIAENFLNLLEKHLPHSANLDDVRSLLS